MKIVPVAAVLVLMTSLATLSTPQTPESSRSRSAAPDPLEFVCLDSTHATIHVLEEPLPSDSTALQSFLWDTFITGPESHRFECLVSGWETRARSHARVLVRKATADSLDAASLETCLAWILENAGPNAYLPIVAAYVTYRGVPAWAILVKWEWVDCSPREVLGHARVFVLDARNTQLLAFATCS